MQEINLLQNKLRDRTASSNRRGTAVVVVTLLLVAVILVAGGFFYFLKQGVDTKISTTLAENLSIQAKLDSNDGEVADAKGFQAQLQNINQLLSSHMYWSTVFDEVQNNILKRAQLNILSLQSDGKIHLEGISDSYTNVGKLVLGLSTSPNLSNVRLASTQRSGGAKAGYSFSIDLVVDTGIVIKK